MCYNKKDCEIRKENVMKVPVGISNRHVHLTKEHLEILFGKDYELQILRPIKQPGQYASNETVTLKTEKSSIEKVRILGPIRSYTQVEISKTDAIKLGINPPVRDSGDLKGSESITIIGPNGSIDLKEGCILATRHVHITKEKMEELGLNNAKYVRVKIEGEKGGVLSHVSLKVTENAYYEMHIDTDDANAFLIKNNDEVEIEVEHEK